MSYSGYKSSPRGGRGFSRGGGGGYRGSRAGSGGGGGWRGGGGGRGFTSSSRGSSRGGRYTSGSGKWDRDVSSGSYESRSRYNSGGERYSSHARDDGSYRYHGDESISSYSSRDRSHRVSSPPTRKRLREEYSPASSMHRSHDYGEGIEYSSRGYGGYESKRMSGGYGGGDDRRTTMFREERERIRSDIQFRKPMSVGAPRHSTPRGSTYRGRSFSRGLRGFRRPDSYRGGSGFIRKRSLMENYGVRKRIATGKTQEYLRRLKMYRLQRLRKLRERADKEGSDEDELDDEENEEEVEEEQEIEEEVTDEEAEVNEEEEEGDKVKKEPEDEEMEEGGEEKKDEPKKKTKKVKKVVKVVKKVKRKISKTKEDDKEKGENDENKELQVTVKQDSEGRDVEEPVRKNSLGQPFMQLECPHCKAISGTFREYMLHLYKTKHQTAMTNLTVKVRKALAKLRLEQRTEQRELDEECKLKKMNMRTFYCQVCKLNYRSLKSAHVRSEKHKEMLNFLNPYCKVCRVACRTPMMYENHICSLNHLKRKYYFDKKNAEKQETELDMDKFMVLDQVGSGEEDESESESEKGENEKGEKTGEEAGGEDGEKVEKEKKPKKKKKLINLGSEYCKKMEIYFCDLCKTFLPRIEDQEQALAVHCRGSTHLRWYVKKKDDITLRKRAERIHRMREEQKKAAMKVEEEEGKEDEPMDEDSTEDKTKKENAKKTNASKEEETEPMETEQGEGMDEKTWNEVNENLGELLNSTADENKSSDDEEDSRITTRRYDRFKHSEKGKTGNADEKDSKTKSEEKTINADVVNGDDKDDA